MLKEKIVPIRPGLTFKENQSPVDRLLRDSIGDGLREIVILGLDEDGNILPSYQVSAEPDNVESRLHMIIEKARQSLLNGEWWADDLKD
jgi:hypothetical protein